MEGIGSVIGRVIDRLAAVRISRDVALAGCISGDSMDGRTKKDAVPNAESGSSEPQVGVATKEVVYAPDFTDPGIPAGTDGWSGHGDDTPAPISCGISDMRRPVLRSPFSSPGIGIAISAQHRENAIRRGVVRMRVQQATERAAEIGGDYVASTIGDWDWHRQACSAAPHGAYQRRESSIPQLDADFANLDLQGGVGIAGLTVGPECAIDTLVDGVLGIDRRQRGDECGLERGEPYGPPLMSQFAGGCMEDHQPLPQITTAATATAISTSATSAAAVMSTPGRSEWGSSGSSLTTPPPGQRRTPTARRS